MIYQNFALIYDELMDHAPYDKWVQFTLDIIEQYNLNVETIIDLGCGTGEITSRLAKHNFHLYGIDNSSDMLTVAQNKAIEGQVAQNTQWINQDIRSLTGFQELDMAVSFCDVFNYIVTEDDLLKSFKNVNSSLRTGGIFLFDVHSLQYANQSLMNNSFTSRNDDVAYVWDCEAGEETGELIHHLSFFVKLEDRLYERFDETHYQRVFPFESYERLLEQAGFTNVTCYSDFSTEKNGHKANSERLFILAETKK